MRLKRKLFTKTSFRRVVRNNESTEPQAGSDVGALTTKAIPQEDGTYRIFGTKIFITFGEHELVENIVQLVLARTPDSPPGTREFPVLSSQSI